MSNTLNTFLSPPPFPPVIKIRELREKEKGKGGSKSELHLHSRKEEEMEKPANRKCERPDKSQTFTKIREKIDCNHSHPFSEHMIKDYSLAAPTPPQKTQFPYIYFRRDPRDGVRARHILRWRCPRPDQGLLRWRAGELRVRQVAQGDQPGGVRGEIMRL